MVWQPPRGLRGSARLPPAGGCFLTERARVHRENHHHRWPCRKLWYPHAALRLMARRVRAEAVASAVADGKSCTCGQGSCTASMASQPRNSHARSSRARAIALNTGQGHCVERSPLLGEKQHAKLRATGEATPVACYNSCRVQAIAYSTQLTL